MKMNYPTAITNLQKNLDEISKHIESCKDDISKKDFEKDFSKILGNFDRDLSNFKSKIVQKNKKILINSKQTKDNDSEYVLKKEQPISKFLSKKLTRVLKISRREFKKVKTGK